MALPCLSTVPMVPLWQPRIGRIIGTFRARVRALLGGLPRPRRLSHLPKVPMPVRILLRSALVALAVVFATSTWAQKVKLETTAGDIVLELDPALAPKTVDNFLQYVKAGHHDGTIFHRVPNEPVVIKHATLQE